ncbi:hypothetical protein [Halobacillus aidingensis]|uniref:Uncharacterized protein n=1 Tax=Halobacillus aidingensis TaxID=240303 RepID=A0A1H0QR83_HALAD|nr:hypothetical protein [Halobacillus aidingensis]SDP19867.1 hypothetical protein SAMN05421677_113100 [Halobacillus aidingensis]
MKGKTFIISLLIITISWGGNLWFYQSKQLEEPIFLEHYYGGAGVFELYYLTNRDESSHVMSVEFSDGTTLHAKSDYYGFHNGNPAYGPDVQSRSTHYLLKKTGFDEQQMRELEVDHEGEATIHFNDGKTMTADIGTVESSELREGNGIFRSQGTSSSSNGRSFRTYTVKEDLKIDSMSSPFPEVQDDLKMKLYAPSIDLTGTPDAGGPRSYSKELDEEWSQVAGAPLENIDFPIDMKQGDRIRLTMQEKPDSIRAYSYEIEFTGTSENGTPFTQPFLVSNHPQFTPEQMELLIERRGSQ